MLAYILRRLVLVVPTLFGIMVINFFIVQAAPGGPVEQTLAQIQGTSVDATERFSGSSSGGETLRKSATDSSGGGTYRGARGLPRELIERIEKMYGFDKPIGERFLLMMKNYLVFDFGESFFRNKRVVDLIIEKMPVSISLGLWTTLLIYFVSIPLGIAKAVRDGSRFDVTTSTTLIVLNAIPGFPVRAAAGRAVRGRLLLQVVPAARARLRRLELAGHDRQGARLFLAHGAADRRHGDRRLRDAHLPHQELVPRGNPQAVCADRARKGLVERRVLYGHVFRNAMLIVIAGFPAAFVGVLFTGSLLIEVIFSLDGIGLLGFEAALNRDYPIMFGTLYFFGLIGLVMGILGDLMYTVVDPRIDFEARA